MELKNGKSSGEVTVSATQPKLKLYNERWLVLIVASFLQFTNLVVWVAFSSVPNMAAVYFDKDLNDINWLITSGFVTDAVLSLPSMWIIDRYGLKCIIYVSGVLNSIGGLIRLFGTFYLVPLQYRYLVTIIGQIVNSSAYPFLMCLPTAVSQIWFPDSQRIFTTAICIMCSSIGMATGVLVAPYLATTPSHLKLVNYFACPLAIASGPLSFIVRRSKPPSPPSISASEEKLSTTATFLQDFLAILKNRNLMILIVCGGGLAYALPFTLFTLGQQLTCPYGYTNIFIGNAEFLFIVCGAVAGPLLALVAEKTTLWEELMKISAALGNCFLIAFLLVINNMRAKAKIKCTCKKKDVVSISSGENNRGETPNQRLPVCQIPNMNILLGFIMIMYGITSLAVWPLVAELAVETAYPVNEGVIGNFIVLSGCIQSAVYVPLVMLFVQPFDEIELQLQSCTVSGLSEAYDMTYCGIFLMSMNTLKSLILIIFCRPKYKRRNAEMLKTQQNLKQTVQTVEASIRL